MEHLHAEILDIEDQLDLADPNMAGYLATVEYLARERNALLFTYELMRAEQRLRSGQGSALNIDSENMNFESGTQLCAGTTLDL